VNVWLQMVPAQISHLGIERVALGCHSGGIIYLLNSLLWLSHALSPTNPYIAIAYECAAVVENPRSGKLEPEA
jgi:hypothetical protein